MTSDFPDASALIPGEPVARRVERRFQEILTARGYDADHVQQSAVELLARWLHGWLHVRRGWRAAPAGVYLWGGVGRGKSFVMDAFFSAVPIQAKRRVHFHAFLHEVQRRLQTITGQRDPLAKVAQEVSSNTRLLCFDEFHVHDIGDAMLLGRLLQMLVEQGVGVVTTSNYPPQGLCPNPLYRDRFKPAITLIEKRFEVFNLDGGQDYRQNAGYVWGEYAVAPTVGLSDWVFSRLGLSAQAQWDVLLEVNHRPLRLLVRDGDRAWLDFDELCRQPRSSADFLWLGREFGTLAVTGVPLLDEQGIDVQQRFLNFIDILYDSGNHLLLAGETTLDQILSTGAHVDFSRTRSRLQQLRQHASPVTELSSH